MAKSSRMYSMSSQVTRDNINSTSIYAIAVHRTALRRPASRQDDLMRSQCNYWLRRGEKLFFLAELSTNPD